MPTHHTLRIAILVSVLALSLPGRARADGFISPFIGFIGGECATSPNCSDKKVTGGVSLGVLGTVAGFEEEIAYTKDFLGTAPGFESSLLTLMSNLVIAPAIGPVRPYGLIGLGLVKTHADFTTLNALLSENNNLGWNVGGGLMVFLGSHVGIRGDVRYIKSLQDVTILGFPLANTKLDFGRASAGIVLKF